MKQNVKHDPAETAVKLDRMRFTKDKLSANLLILAIVLDALYFVRLYQSDVSNYYYTWKNGASVIYNLVFLLAVFLCSEGVKNRQNGFLPIMMILGIMQFVRIFYIPVMAHKSVITISDVEYPVMSDGQFYYMIGLLIASGACILTAAVTSTINNKRLEKYQAGLQKTA